MLNQYHDIIFVDCGGLDGYTSVCFKLLTNDCYNEIIIFEPDPDNYNLVLSNCLNDNRVRVINAGVWDKKDTLCFDSGNGGSSKIVLGTEKLFGRGAISIKTESIDSLQLSGHVFIKMDIEGAEMMALKGAEKTIRATKPLLAICIYHSNEDMVEIPRWIMDTCGLQDYAYFLRHHSECYPETVFYAIPKCWD